jgi:outer membrane protein insertion porin family
MQIMDITYVGNERIGSQTIKFYTKLEPSSYVNNDNIDSIIKSLYKTKLFANVNAFIDDGKNLVIKVQENPLTSIRSFGCHERRASSGSPNFA